jgi:hypothetical protein
MKKTIDCSCTRSRLGVEGQNPLRCSISPYAEFKFEPPDGELLNRPQAADKATAGVVAALEAVFGREVLVNALGAQALITLGLDDVSPQLAIAQATAGSTCPTSPESGTLRRLSYHEPNWRQVP